MPPVASSSTSRALFVFLCPARRRQLSFFLDPLRSCRPNKPSCPTQSRAVSTASPQRSEMEVSPEDSQTPPRWSQTPPAMRSPVPIPSKPNAKPWIVNSDPQKLDQMYQKFLGKGGEKLLGEETRWLAITHKSFDHGRRGFNDRLSFLGMRILELQTSLALLTVSDSSRYLKEKDQDELKREAFRHPAINSVECLLGGARTHFTSHKQLSELGTGYGLPEVVRWKPKNVSMACESRSCMD